MNYLYKDIPVLTVTPIYRFDDGFKQERFDAVVEKIRSVCAEYSNISVLCGWDLVYHIKECYVDCVHPNAYGSELMAQGIYEHMCRVGF